jgi:hypothetical protein
MESRVTPSTTASQPTPEGAVSETLQELYASTEPWTAAEIGEFFGVSRNLVWHWVRACRNYQFHGADVWPPTQRELRHAYEPTPDAPQRDWWPPHPSILPPCIPLNSNGRERWLKGEVVRWARLTNRVDGFGNPVRLKAGTRGRGRASSRTVGRAEPDVG